jgi:hypothetical protein
MLAQLAGRAGIPMNDFLAAVISQIPPYSDWNQLRSELEKIDEIFVKTGNRNDE